MTTAPLDGIHILSTAINVPGPAAAARLAAMGARVTKVEPPTGDPLRLFSPAWYAELTAGQTILTLDHKDPAHQRELHDRLAAADLLLTASRPAALERLGLHWTTLHTRHPRLAHVGITGFPHPNENVSGHDLNYLAELGLLQPPHMPITLLADLAGAERAAAEALALILQRERTGVAAQSWVSLYESAQPFAAPLRHSITTPGAVLGGGLPGYRVYQTADGYIAVAALELHFLQRLEAMTGIAPITHDALEALFKTETSAAWHAKALDADIPIAIVQTTPPQIP